jgi:hypothetical protein
MMMSRSFLGLNGLLAAASVVFAAQIGREYLRPPQAPAARARPAGPAVRIPGPNPVALERRAPSGNYAASIAAKNLFSPTRMESSVAETAALPVPVGPKPLLFGIVLDSTPVAYLEDPATKRVAAYRIGDSIAGGTVQSIAADHVTLKRADGAVDVQLRDPSKPRPAPTEPPSPAQPGALPAVQPGLTRQQRMPPGQAVPVPAPNLLRRLPVPRPQNPDAPDEQ